MNADRLLSHFERISEAPDAVDRLRRLILDLAVRGKLVDQEVGDEPADVLLSRIASRKPASSSHSKTRPAAEKEPDPYPLPPSWAWTAIANLGLLSPRNDADSSVVSSFVPMSLISAAFGVDASHEKRPWGEIKKGYTHIADGDVAVAKITPCFENGKSTVFRKLTGGIGAGTTELHVVRPIEVSPDYIVLFLKSPLFIENGIPRMTGTAGQKRVPGDYFAYRPFPLPPLAEQHRIVAKVDELMKLCDRLEASQRERESCRDRVVGASLKRLSQPTDPDEFKKDAGFQLSNLNRLTTKPEHIKELRKAILNLAVRGKLVPQEAMLAEQEGRPYESASDLVLRLSGDGKHNKTAHKQSAKPVSATLPDLPAGWAWTTMPEIGELNRGRSRHRPRNEKRLYGGPYPFIQTGDVRRSLGTIRHYDQTYSEMGLSQSRMWPQNTLCITIAANIAETGILTFDACFPDSVVGFRYDDPEMPVRYLEYFLRTAKERLSDFAPATAQKNINLDVLANVHVPLPPLAEQKRIVAKVDELMLICDQLETQLESQQKGRRQLLEALLYEALEGVG